MSEQLWREYSKRVKPGLLDADQTFLIVRHGVVAGRPQSWVDFGQWMLNLGWRSKTSPGWINDVTHWMPLPELPEAPALSPRNEQNGSVNT